MRWKRTGIIAIALVVVLVGCGRPTSTGGAPSEAESRPAGLKRITAAVMTDLPTISSNYVGAGSGTLPGGDAIEDLVNGGLTVVDRYMTTIPVDERNRVLGDIVYHMTDQVVIIGLWYNTEPVLIGSRLKNVTVRDFGGTTEAWNGHVWDVG